MEQHQKSPEDIHAKMDRIYGRLVKLGYANPQVSDKDSDDVLRDYTAPGMRLRADILKIYDIPPKSYMDIPPEDIYALWLLLVSFEPD